MATATCTAPSESIVERLIRPAILKLVGETDGSYRCERDLHHHYTLCLNSIEPLFLGTRRRRVFLEHPGKACYGSGRNGNLDYFFPDDKSASILLGNRTGTAMELNYNYDDSLKVTRDIQKLIDPDNGYVESAYFALGRRSGFVQAVRCGIQRAFEYFAEDRPDFRLPVRLHIFVVDTSGGASGYVLYETSVQRACGPDELVWKETPLDGYTSPELETNQNITPIDRSSLSDSDLCIDRATAHDLLSAEMHKAGIPLESKTARCMFEATRNSSGRNRCKLGVTPLWDNELRVVAERVLRSEFMDWVNRLCESGHTFQRAGRASWDK
jgi:hypothetical protein